MILSFHHFMPLIHSDDVQEQWHYITWGTCLFKLNSKIFVEWMANIGMPICEVLTFKSFDGRDRKTAFRESEKEIEFGNGITRISVLISLAELNIAKASGWLTPCYILTKVNDIDGLKYL